MKRHWRERGAGDGEENKESGAGMERERENKSVPRWGNTERERHERG